MSNPYLEKIAAYTREDVKDALDEGESVTNTSASLGAASLGGLGALVGRSVGKSLVKRSPVGRVLGPRLLTHGTVAGMYLGAGSGAALGVGLSKNRALRKQHEALGSPNNVTYSDLETQNDNYNKASTRGLLGGSVAGAGVGAAAAAGYGAARATPKAEAAARAKEMLRQRYHLFKNRPANVRGVEVIPGGRFLPVPYYEKGTIRNKSLQGAKAVLGSKRGAGAIVGATLVGGMAGAIRNGNRAADESADLYNRLQRN